MSLTVESLAHMEQLGLIIDEDPTLLETPEYKHHRARINKIVARSPKMSKRPPWEYQARNSAIAACRTRNLLAHEQGLGKTYETILIIEDRYEFTNPKKWHKRPKPNTVSILAPVHSLRLAWMKEFTECGMEHLVDIILTEEDARMSRKPIWLMDVNNFLKNQAQRGKNLSRNGKMRSRLNRYKELEEYFLGYQMWKSIKSVAMPHMVVIDEIHGLRKDTERTIATKHFVRGVENRLGLTGTPVDGWVEHLATVLEVLYGTQNELFPWDAASFTKRFTRTDVVNRDYVTGDEGESDAVRRQVPGINPDQIPEFRNATCHLMHRQVYKDPEVNAHVKFPPVRHHLEIVPMDKDHEAYYFGLSAEIVRLIEESVKAIDNDPTNLFRLKQNVLTHLNLLRQAEACPWAIDGLYRPYPVKPTAKMERLLDICGDMASQGRKTLVFTNFVQTGKPICDMLKAAGLGVTRVYANDPTEDPKSLKQEAREDRIEAFLTEGSGIDVAVCNLGLVATALTMVQASAVVHVDHDWKSNPYKQGNSRIIRPGQVWPWVDVFDLVHDRTVARYVFYALLQKVRANAEMIDRQFSLADPNAPKIELDPVAIARAMMANTLKGP